MIDYQKFVTDAYMSVVKNALMVASVDPDPAKICFYITLETTDANVVIPEWLRAQYPTSLTIVLNEQFDNLDIMDSYFSVIVYFDGKAVQIDAPFEAIIAFVDPLNDFKVGFTSSRNDGSAIPMVNEELPDGDNSNVISFDDYKNKN